MIRYLSSRFKDSPYKLGHRTQRSIWASRDGVPQNIPRRYSVPRRIQLYLATPAAIIIMAISCNLGEMTALDLA